MKKSILVVTNWYPDEKNIFSGIFIKDQAVILSQVFPLILVAIKIDNRWFSPLGRYKVVKENDQGLLVYRVTVSRTFPVYKQLVYFVSALHFLLKTFPAKTISAVHCHVSYPAGVVGYLFKKFTGIPYIITEHFGGFTGLFRTPVHKYLLLRALKKADEVTTVSKASEKIITQYIHRPVRIVPNVIHLSQFPLVSPRKSSEKIIGFLGGLNTDVKGLDILLKALAKIERRDYSLKIGGAGKLMDRYQVLAGELNIADRCEFMGVINPDNRPDFYRQLDFFLLPSRRESFGVVLLEAMACGLPVIATRCGGPDSIVKNFTGMLVEANNIEALAAAIEKMFTVYEQYDRQRIRRYVGEQFGEQSFISKMKQIYSDVTGRTNLA